MEFLPVRFIICFFYWNEKKKKNDQGMKSNQTSKW